MDKRKAKPFLKWAGGKGQLLETLEAMFPTELAEGKIKNYIEPFIGGGAVLFHLLQHYSIEKAYINDINQELINCYQCIQNNVEEVIKRLEIYEKEYHQTSDRTQYFYRVRDEFNADMWSEKPHFGKCADFIFLNKTCFNGLYRVNKEGKFNVPHGKYKNPVICDKENLRLCSELLQKVEITCGDYQSAIEKADENTFVYLDPPYRPLIANNSFVSYDKAGFCDEDQKELAKNYKLLHEKGCLLMLSDSDPKNIDENDEFFDQLYRDFIVERVKAKRMINSDATKRGDITEIVVINYPKEKN